MADQNKQYNDITPDEHATNIKDRGGRRRLADRRNFSSSEHFPERRVLRYRRSGNDRRTLQNQKIRKKSERRRLFKEKYLVSDNPGTNPSEKER